MTKKKFFPFSNVPMTARVLLLTTSTTSPSGSASGPSAPAEGRAKTLTVTVSPSIAVPRNFDAIEDFFHRRRAPGFDDALALPDRPEHPRDPVGSGRRAASEAPPRGPFDLPGLLEFVEEGPERPDVVVRLE